MSFAKIDATARVLPRVLAKSLNSGALAHEARAAEHHG